MTQTPFDIPNGLNADDTIFSAPGAWANSSLIRFYENAWQIKGGWQRFSYTNLPTPCRSVFAWKGTTSLLNVAFGCADSLWVWQGGQMANLTPSGFTAGANDGSGQSGYGTGPYGQNSSYGVVSPSQSYFPMTWSFSAYGGDLVANPRGQTIWLWEQDFGTPTLPRPLGGSGNTGLCPQNVTYTVTVPQRQIMALGCNQESGNAFNPLNIRWSDIENPDMWQTLPTNNAGEYTLTGTGEIVCGRVTGNYVWIWTTTDLWLATYVGDPGQTWQFQKIGTNCGAISPGSPVVQGQNAMWLTPDQMFWQCSLGGAPSQQPCPVRSLFANHIAQGQAGKIVGGSTSTFQEITWWWPDDRDGLECSRSVTVSPQGWSTDLLPRTAYVDAGPAPVPIGVAPTGQSYYHETGQTADTQPLTGFIESAGFYIGEAPGNMLVRGCWPDFKVQNCPLSLTVFMREYPQAVERVYGPWTLSPGQLKRSFRVQGRIARVRYDFSASPAFARSGKQEFDVEPIGGR